jgi:hypothetical protein
MHRRDVNGGHCVSPGGLQAYSLPQPWLRVLWLVGKRLLRKTVAPLHRVLCFVPWHRGRGCVTATVEPPPHAHIAGILVVPRRSESQRSA